jgi:hypothetical protein
MKIDGRCHCGFITYEATVDPQFVGMCHCTDCQTFSSAPFRVGVPAGKGDLRFLSGQPKVYVKVADSGNKRSQAFCPECGTPIYTAAATDPSFYTIRLGTVRQRNELVPTVQIWCQSAMPWLGDLDSVPKIEGQPPVKP